VVQGEALYPQCLLELHDPPCFVTALGDTALMARRRVGIVGTRQASASGERIARGMAELIVRAGAVVVSGMAFGIDAAAHRGALDAAGGTIAVLGSGVDMPYPPRHRDLHERIAQHGLVLSEAPIGSHPVPGAFPRRNRLIAALSETLVVIEAGERSGALITSRHALELGRTVAAVPGPIDSPRHVGSNRLLADGAAFLAQVEDVIHVAELDDVVVQSPDSGRDAQLSEDSHRTILEAVRGGICDVEVLARTTSLAPRDLTAALTALEMSGRLEVTPSGVVALT
jgi:DNA processing protein